MGISSACVRWLCIFVSRINAEARNNGICYSQLINGLKKASMTVNRKMFTKSRLLRGWSLSRSKSLTRNIFVRKPIKQRRDGNNHRLLFDDANINS
jgi:hypothetical protein